ncbi:3'-5' exonuclease [Cyclobacterium amurskyense]|uniref:3'-5' exonuclease, PolB-like protein n=1 Tax=Cyclobacterium amurskyense TaxID=320787 RepID=A0A0H4PBC6_9BACT|nr:3'-5' exonuclease [Cyclobacterium amurskyense]AKP51514.1 3'-5' exonuclease, PolB-like protein [Cyclobacterium amurskyense]|tara:strand:- start:12716 stop:13450 length:735 start_codon:yes stop_codon:yes gene_type:complete
MADFFEHLNDILFLDIETISGAESLRDLPSRMQEEWTKKAQQLQKTDEREADDLYFEKAGIYAEFGKVICIGVGYFTYKKAEDELIYRTKSYAASTEHETLLEFRDLLEKKDWILCAHNGKEFDIPYICRRMLVNKLPLPDVLQLSGKKPWEIKHIDTLDLWKFGDYKHYTRLDLLAAIFDIPSSKEGIDGSMVNSVYYKENDLDNIRKYCLRDVEVTARIYLAYQGLPGDLSFQIINLDSSAE